MPIIEVMRAGVDWITLTLPSGAEGTAEWRNRGIKALEAIANEGQVIKPRGMLGYYGVSAGNCFVGEREADSMMQFTGHYADTYFEDIYRNDAHTSRIDVQVTVKTIKEELDVAKEAYAGATEDNNRLPVTRRRKLFIIMGSDGGDTFYLGSPSSDQRGRIYNKERQSEEPAYTRCWRYETVYRNGFAVDTAHRIHIARDKRANICSAIVASWFAARGVDVDWWYRGVLLPAPLVRTLPTDIETKLRWIEEQVKPTIRLLCEAGYRDILLESLFPNVERGEI